jgi:hypothetical protein
LSPSDEWTSIFGSERLTGALLDRLTVRRQGFWNQLQFELSEYLAHLVGVGYVNAETTQAMCRMSPAASALGTIEGANSIMLAKAVESIRVRGFMAILLDQLCGQQARINHRMTKGELKRCAAHHIPVTVL